MENGCLEFRDEEYQEQGYLNYGMEADMRPRECSESTAALPSRRSCLTLFELISQEVEGSLWVVVRNNSN